MKYIYLAIKEGFFGDRVLHEFYGAFSNIDMATDSFQMTDEYTLSPVSNSSMIVYDKLHGEYPSFRALNELDDKIAYVIIIIELNDSIPPFLLGDRFVLSKMHYDALQKGQLRRDLYNEISSTVTDEMHDVVSFHNIR